MIINPETYEFEYEYTLYAREEFKTLFGKNPKIPCNETAGVEGVT